MIVHFFIYFFKKRWILDILLLLSPIYNGVGIYFTFIYVFVLSYLFDCHCQNMVVVTWWVHVWVSANFKGRALHDTVPMSTFM